MATTSMFRVMMAGLGLALSILAQPVFAATENEEESELITHKAPTPASGLIRPLAPPDTLVLPARETETVFGDFTYDDDLFREPSLSLISRTQYENHITSGPGRESSFLESGGHFMSDLDVRALRPIGEGWQGELSSTARLTQSRRYDPQDFSMQYFQLAFSNDDNSHHITLGDYYASLSQYTLNRGIKGVGYQKVLADQRYIRLAGGSMHARWDHVFGRKENEPVDRNALGLRMQTGGDRYLLGFNLLSAWDRDNDPNRTTETTYRQALPSVDWEYRLAGLRLSGEHAYAPTQRQQEIGGTRENIYGTANRINAQASMGKLRLQGRTEHVTPDFFTMGGGAAIDRFRVFFRGDYRLNRTWSLYGGNDWFRNNLDGQLTATTKTTIPEVGIRAQGLFDRRSLSFSSGLRRRIVKTDAPQERETVSDRLHFALGDRFQQISLRGEVEILVNENKSPTPKTRREDNLYRLVADSRHLIKDGMFDLRPYLTLEHQEVEDPGTGEPIRTNSARFDLRVLTLHDLSFGLNLETRTSRSDIDGFDNTEERRMGFNAEKRPEFLGGGSLRGEFSHNRFSFSDSERNYRETMLLFFIEYMFNTGN